MVKLFFDNCISPRITEAIRNVLQYDKNTQTEVVHLLDRFSGGTKDESWISAIAEEGWTVITADRGKRSGGAKLPIVCSHFNITNFILSGSLPSAAQVEKARAIIYSYPFLKQISQSEQGLSYRIIYSDSDRQRFKLEQRNLNKK